MIILDDFITGLYDDPGDQCENDLVPVRRHHRAGTSGPGCGYYCGSRAQPGYATLLNEEKGAVGLPQRRVPRSTTTPISTPPCWSARTRRSTTPARASGCPTTTSTRTRTTSGTSTEQHAGDVPAHLRARRSRAATAAYYDRRFEVLQRGVRHQGHVRRFGLGLRRLLQPLRLQGDVRPAVAAGRRDGGLLPRPVPRPAARSTYYGYPVYAPDKDAFYQRDHAGAVPRLLRHHPQRVADLDAEPQPAGGERQAVRPAGRPGRHGRRAAGRQPVLGQPDRPARQRRRRSSASTAPAAAASAPTRRSARSSRCRC